MESNEIRRLRVTVQDAETGETLMENTGETIKIAQTALNMRSALDEMEDED